MAAVIGELEATRYGFPAHEPTEGLVIRFRSGIASTTKHALAVFSVVVACALLAPKSVTAQKRTLPPERDHRRGDTALEAMRREAEARKKEKEQTFSRIIALTPPPSDEVRQKAMKISAELERQARLAPIRDLELDRQALIFKVRWDVVIKNVLRALEGDMPDGDTSPELTSEISGETFERGLFGKVGNTVAARDRLNVLFKVKIQEAGATRHMTVGQKEKLELAGRGDIERFFDKVERKRTEFALLRADPAQFWRCFQELQPLRCTFAFGPFGEGAIFTKTLKKMADEDQIAGRRPR
jgi:hypothetical protein